MELTEQHDHEAREKIKRLRQQSATNWAIPDEFAAKAFEIAETAKVSPAQALLDATNFVDGLKKRNVARQEKLAKARKLRADLIALEEERGPRKKVDKKEKPTRRQAPGWLARWLNGSASSVVPKSVQEEIDEEILTEIVEHGGDADKGLMAKVSDEESEEKSAQAEQSSPTELPEKRPTAPVQNAERRGCIGLLLFWRTKSKVESPADPAEHGIPLPLTNAGTRGWQGLLQRWLLTALNATPTSGLNWMEVTKDGLQIYQPLANVSQRAIKHNQARDGQVVLSVNPPAYFDSLLGMLRQFRRDVETPWGEIVIYEGGSGRVIASAIAVAPAQKLKQIRAALELLHLADNEAEGFRRIPQLRDLLIYVEDGDDLV